MLYTGRFFLSCYTRELMNISGGSLVDWDRKLCPHLEKE